MSGAEKCHCSSVVRSSQFTVRDVGREGSEVSREGVELRSFRGSWSRLRSMLSEPDASRSGKSGLVSSAKRRYLKLVIGSVHPWPVERTKGSPAARFGADRGDGAAPLSCEVARWIHGAPARLWVPPHLKSDTLCCKRWPCSLLMLVREKRWFWIASTSRCQTRHHNHHQTLCPICCR